ncbi:hypothetical protein AD936_20510, partial [Gluconobacter japonicus]
TATDGFKADQVPGASVALHGFGAGTEALTAADTGADTVISDSESDMGDAGPQSAGPTSNPKAQAQKPAPSDGDIGVGGLY